MMIKCLSLKFSPIKQDPLLKVVLKSIIQTILINCYYKNTIEIIANLSTALVALSSISESVTGNSYDCSFKVNLS